MQYDNQDNRPQARAQTMKIVAEYLQSITETAKEE
jgi:hypothetical protein